MGLLDEQKLLDSLIKQKESLFSQHTALLNENHKGFGVRRWKKKVNESEDALKQLDKQIDKLNKRIYDLTLAEQGKDVKTSRQQVWGDVAQEGLKQTGSTLSAIYGGQWGKFGAGAASGAGTNTPLGGTFIGSGGSSVSGKGNQSILFIGIGALLLILFMRKK